MLSKKNCNNTEVVRERGFYARKKLEWKGEGNVPEPSVPNGGGVDIPSAARMVLHLCQKGGTIWGPARTLHGKVVTIVWGRLREGRTASGLKRRKRRRIQSGNNSKNTKLTPGSRRMGSEEWVSGSSGRGIDSFRFPQTRADKAEKPPFPVSRGAQRGIKDFMGQN